MRPESAGDELHVDTAIDKLGKQHFEFAIADERVSADDRQMERLVLVDQLEHAVDQLLSFEIREAAQVGGAEMRVFVGVASGTAQRAFFGDFQRKAGNTADKGSAPRLQNWLDLHCGQLHIHFGCCSWMRGRGRGTVESVLGRRLPRYRGSC